jgi:putative transposase
MHTKAQFSLVGKMLKKALRCLWPMDKPMLHSDQGWHYQQPQYRHMLPEKGVAQSMSRDANCLDTQSCKASSERSSPSFNT